jgi:hypothetical protein
MNVPFTFRNKQPFPQMPYGHRSLQLLLFKPPRWAIDRGGATIALTDPEDPEISLLKPSPESRTAPACASVGPCPAAAAEGETARCAAAAEGETARCAAANATDSLPHVAQNHPVSCSPQWTQNTIAFTWVACASNWLSLRSGMLSSCVATCSHDCSLFRQSFCVRSDVSELHSLEGGLVHAAAARCAPDGLHERK